MKPWEYFIRGNRRVLITCMFLSFISVLSAQKPSDFSGTWVMDLGKSDANYGKFYSQLTCVIKQTPETITIERTGTSKEGKAMSQDPMMYNLSGKEIAREQYGGTDKYSAAWSADKKNLILKMVRTVNGADYGSSESYTLSPDGKILSVDVADLKGETKIVEVYNRK